MAGPWKRWIREPGLCSSNEHNIVAVCGKNRLSHAQSTSIVPPLPGSGATWAGSFMSDFSWPRTTGGHDQTPAAEVRVEDHPPVRWEPPIRSANSGPFAQLIVPGAVANLTEYTIRPSHAVKSLFELRDAVARTYAPQDSGPLYRHPSWVRLHVHFGRGGHFSGAQTVGGVPPGNDMRCPATVARSLGDRRPHLRHAQGGPGGCRTDARWGRHVRRR